VTVKFILMRRKQMVIFESKGMRELFGTEGRK
jgi:hypothetical protein